MKEQLLQLIALLRDDVLTNAKTDGTTQLQCSYLYDITGKMADLLTKPDFKKKIKKSLSPYQIMTLKTYKVEKLLTGHLTV